MDSRPSSSPLLASPRTASFSPASAAVPPLQQQLAWQTKAPPFTSPAYQQCTLPATASPLIATQDLARTTVAMRQSSPQVLMHPSWPAAAEPLAASDMLRSDAVQSTTAGAVAPQPSLHSSSMLGASAPGMSGVPTLSAAGPPAGLPVAAATAIAGPRSRSTAGLRRATFNYTGPSYVPAPHTSGAIRPATSTDSGPTGPMQVSSALPRFAVAGRTTYDGGCNLPLAGPRGAMLPHLSTSNPLVSLQPQLLPLLPPPFESMLLPTMPLSAEPSYSSTLLAPASVPEPVVQASASAGVLQTMPPAPTKSGTSMLAQLVAGGADVSLPAPLALTPVATAPGALPQLPATLDSTTQCAQIAPGADMGSSVQSVAAVTTNEQPAPYSAATSSWSNTGDCVQQLLGYDSLRLSSGSSHKSASATPSMFHEAQPVAMLAALQQQKEQQGHMSPAQVPAQAAWRQRSMSMYQPSTALAPTLVEAGTMRPQQHNAPQLQQQQEAAWPPQQPELVHTLPTSGSASIASGDSGRSWALMRSVGCPQPALAPNFSYPPSNPTLVRPQPGEASSMSTLGSPHASLASSDSGTGVTAASLLQALQQQQQQQQHLLHASQKHQLSELHHQLEWQQQQLHAQQQLQAQQHLQAQQQLQAQHPPSSPSVSQARSTLANQNVHGMLPSSPQQLHPSPHAAEPRFSPHQPAQFPPTSNPQELYSRQLQQLKQVQQQQQEAQWHQQHNQQLHQHQRQPHFDTMLRRQLVSGGDVSGSSAGGRYTPDFSSFTSVAPAVPPACSDGSGSTVYPDPVPGCLPLTAAALAAAGCAMQAPQALAASGHVLPVPQLSAPSQVHAGLGPPLAADPYASRLGTFPYVPSVPSTLTPLLSYTSGMSLISDLSSPSYQSAALCGLPSCQSLAAATGGGSFAMGGSGLGYAMSYGGAQQSMTCSHTDKVRVLLSLGGVFVRSASGGHEEYQGGETRLISISRTTQLQELHQQIARACRLPLSEAWQLRYQLPANPEILVDLVHDEDVANMLDEWADYCQVSSNSSYKLRVLLQMAPTSQSNSRANSLGSHCSTQTLLSRGSKRSSLDVPLPHIQQHFTLPLQQQQELGDEPGLHADELHEPPQRVAAASRTGSGNDRRSDFGVDNGHSAGRMQTQLNSPFFTQQDRAGCSGAPPMTSPFEAAAAGLSPARSSRRPSSSPQVHFALPPWEFGVPLYAPRRSGQSDTAQEQDDCTTNVRVQYPQLGKMRSNARGSLDGGGGGRSSSLRSVRSITSAANGGSGAAADLGVNVGSTSPFAVEQKCRPGVYGRPQSQLSTGRGRCSAPGNSSPRACCSTDSAVPCLVGGGGSKPSNSMSDGSDLSAGSGGGGTPRVSRLESLREASDSSGPTTGATEDPCSLLQHAMLTTETLAQPRAAGQGTSSAGGECSGVTSGRQSTASQGCPDSSNDRKMLESSIFCNGCKQEASSTRSNCTCEGAFSSQLMQPGTPGCSTGVLTSLPDATVANVTVAAAAASAPDKTSVSGVPAIVETHVPTCDAASADSAALTTATASEAAGEVVNTMPSTYMELASPSRSALSPKMPPVPPPRVALSSLEARSLQIIRPDELQVVRFLGAGGFGEVYLCKWHAADVAVKSLNHSLLLPDASGNGSASGQAIADLLKEAALLGSLRHPNIVFVYGVVLPAAVQTLVQQRSDASRNLLHARSLSSNGMATSGASIAAQVSGASAALQSKPMTVSASRNGRRLTGGGEEEQTSIAPTSVELSGDSHASDASSSVRGVVGGSVPGGAAGGISLTGGAAGGLTWAAGLADIDAVDLAQQWGWDQPVLPGMIRPPALVTEFMPYGSLHTALKANSPIVQSPAVRVKLALDASRGLEYLHAKRIIHFDVKAANLLLGMRGRTPQAKVADFGLSKQRQQTFVTGMGAPRGTLPWTAPEIIRTPTRVSEKVDVYSFGVLLWEIWTGWEPFEGTIYLALMHEISTKSNVRPPLPGSDEWEGECLPELAPGWCDLMQRCWAEDPSSRPTFATISSELDTMLVAMKAQRAAVKAAAAASADASA